MAIEIVDFPIKNGDFPWQNVSSPEGTSPYHIRWQGFRFWGLSFFVGGLGVQWGTGLGLQRENMI